MSINASIKIRVQAQGGKFLGDDIGGALITVRDAQTGKVLSSGLTAGTSGSLVAAYQAGASLSTIVTPATPPTIQWVLAADSASRSANTSSYTANLELNRPTLLEIEAFGPIGGLQSAHRVTTTEWIAPGQYLTTLPGLVLMLPGLLVQVMSPATHTQYAASGGDRTMTIEASVAMMCGCPISNLPNNPWLPSDFTVTAEIREVGGSTLPTVTLDFSSADTPSRFSASYTVPTNTTSSPIFYEVTITAKQVSTGNFGTGTATFFVLGAPATTSKSGSYARQSVAD